MSAELVFGRVIKAVASRFYVNTEDGVLVCSARKKLKNDGDILVGDLVKVAKERGACVIEEVHLRRNSLIRPYVANVDVCLIVIAPVPAPDFLLVDKIIINCLYENIKPVLVANKIDILKVPEISDYYGILDIFSCSAASGEGIDALLSSLSGATVCFAGQSAVGKSSIINAFLKTDKLRTAPLSKKVQRGRHTTRQSELLSVGDCYLIDTCGFSMLDTVELKPSELGLYYDEFEPLRPLCAFRSCTHTTEPNCAVKSEIGLSVSKARYERYLTIYNELKERESNKYKG